jgi:hypothetical protein
VHDVHAELSLDCGSFAAQAKVTALPPPVLELHAARAPRSASVPER